MEAGGERGSWGRERESIFFNFFSLTGAPLPTPIAAGASVPHGDTFFIAGGIAPSSRNLNTLYRYNVDADSWTLMPDRMARGRLEAAAFPVAKEAFPACK